MSNPALLVATGAELTGEGTFVERFLTFLEILVRKPTIGIDPTHTRFTTLVPAKVTLTFRWRFRSLGDQIGDGAAEIGFLLNGRKFLRTSLTRGLVPPASGQIILQANVGANTTIEIFVNNVRSKDDLNVKSTALVITSA